MPHVEGMTTNGSRDPELSILGIVGSLRKQSLNRQLMGAAVELAPAGTAIEVYGGLGEIPPYNADLDGVETPDVITDFREQIRRADGLLIATPEYNYSIPGVLKNAIDWASRPPQTSVLRHKPVATMGAAPGNFGTVRAQLALRQCWLWTQSVPVMKPEVHVFRAAERFNEAGKLTDPMTQDLVGELLAALRTLILSRHKPPT